MLRLLLWLFRSLSLPLPLWSVQQSSSALVWTSPLLTGTPNPLRPAFSRTRWSDSTGASTHLTVIQLSFCHSWNGDISFKIYYSVASLTPPHTAFCFYFSERKKKKHGPFAFMCHATLATHVKLWSVWVCLCGWWTESSQEAFESHVIKDDVSLYP